MPQAALSLTVPEESALVDHLQRLNKLPGNRLAAHVKLSHLSRAHMREHYLDLAIDRFADAVKGYEGRIFRLHNHDLLYISSGVPLKTVDRAVDRLRSLFSEDPVFVHRNVEPFVSWYRVEQDYDFLLTKAREWQEDADLAQADYARTDPTAGFTPLQPELLARIDRALETADFTNLARRQMVCTLIKDQPPQPVFEEIYVSIFELQAQVTPGVNWLANPWLFQYITQKLDKRMMAALMRRGAKIAAPFSLNLNVASVLTPEFRRFDEIVAPQVKGRMVVEFNKLDVFADMGAYLFVRDYLHERGYRLCLDGLSHLTLPYFNRAKLGFDLVKLFWRPDGIEDLPEEMIPAMREMILEVGQARTILCRCENATSIEIGQQLGIVMFQGRWVDRMSLAANKN